MAMDLGVSPRSLWWPLGSARLANAHTIGAAQEVVSGLPAPQMLGRTSLDGPKNPSRVDGRSRADTYQRCGGSSARSANA